MRESDEVLIKRLFKSQTYVWICNKTKSYQIYQRIALLFIFLHQPSIFQLLQPQTSY